MPDYDYSEFRNRPLSQRFPEWAIGWHLWREYGDGGPETIRPLLDALVLSRLSANWGTSPLACPRLFISHRQRDDRRARDIAVIARAAGFQVWLDVEDPLLTAMTGTPSASTALLTAAIIETALLNSTHVIAVMTTNTAGSKWVPYEYGRAKDSSMYSLQAACWIDSRVPQKDLGEYLLLGVTTRTDPEIERWLGNELTWWNWQFGTCPRGAAENDRHPRAARQPPADVDAIAQTIMSGLERPIIVRGPLRLKPPVAV
jgi:hypothetical protein